MSSSIIEYCGVQSKSRCGYCKNSSGSNSHGMWAHNLNVQDYQDLIDRGWRRSGRYCYKPTMHNTCCPLYTIRCNAMDVKLSKSQKKIIKRVNRFLLNGVKEMSHSDNITDSSNEGEDSSLGILGFPSAPSTKSNIVNINVEQIITTAEVNISQVTNSEHSITDPSTSDDIHSHSSISNTFKSTNINVKKGAGVDETKPPCKKAKLLRLERKNAKLTAKGLSPIETKPKPPASNEKYLEELLNNAPSNSKHKLEFVLVKVNSEEFKKSMTVSSELFAKYQMRIHHDKPEDCDYFSFNSFLCESPLAKASNDFGTFHHQYYLDGHLIAVGVIDILPYCVSSVYFYYDPEYSHLSLGTYGSLRELELTRSLNLKYANIKYYYMGFYVHTCPKMRYKAKLSPSYLLCPEVYKWVEIEKCLPKLDVSPYSRLTDSTEKDENAVNNNGDSLNAVLVLFRNTALPYEYYSRRPGVCDQKEVLEYANLVGLMSASNMLLYREA